jgi:hypothetical protein
VVVEFVFELDGTPLLGVVEGISLGSNRWNSRTLAAT